LLSPLRSSILYIYDLHFSHTMSSEEVTERVTKKEAIVTHSNQQILTPFEWLTNFNSLSELLHPSYLFPKKANKEHEKQCDVLHIGCGNSALSESLLQRYNNDYSSVVNADIDSEVLSGMKQRWDLRWKLGNDFNTNSVSTDFHSKMKWIQLDFREEFESLCDTCANSKIKFNGGFDLVIDKSTLDCALCSDESTTGLICNTYSALNPDGGVYFVVTFHHFDFIMPLLQNCPGADWDVECHVVQREVDIPEGLKWTTKRYFNNSNTRGGNLTSIVSSVCSREALLSSEDYRRNVNVFICRRTQKVQDRKTGLLDRDTVSLHIAKVNDTWFKTQNPLMTHLRKKDLQRLFKEKISSLNGLDDSTIFINSSPPPDLDHSSGFLSLKHCYEILFTDAEKEHLPYEHFIDDWNAFIAIQSPLTVDSSSVLSPFPKDGMTLQTAIDFLAEMQ